MQQQQQQQQPPPPPQQQQSGADGDAPQNARIRTPAEQMLDSLRSQVRRTLTEITNAPRMLGDWPELLKTIAAVTSRLSSILGANQSANRVETDLALMRELQVYPRTLMLSSQAVDVDRYLADLMSAHPRLEIEQRDADMCEQYPDLDASDKFLRLTERTMRVLRQVADASQMSGTIDVNEGLAKRRNPLRSDVLGSVQSVLRGDGDRK